MSLSVNTESKNIGAVKKLALIALSNLQSIPGMTNGEIIFDDLSIAAGATFEDIYFTSESCSFDESDSRERAGILWTKNISLSIPKVRAEVIAGLRNYEGKQLAALVTDFNDTSFLVFPLRITRKKQIPGSFSSKNAVLIQLGGKSVSESPVITDIP